MWEQEGSLALGAAEPRGLGPRSPWSGGGAESQAAPPPPRQPEWTGSLGRETSRV